LDLKDTFVATNDESEGATTSAVQWKGAPVATYGATAIDLHTLLQSLHQRRQLKPLIRQIIVEQFLLEAASELGIRPTDAELQQWSHLFRRRNGLNKADQTRAWLEHEGLAVPTFEAGLERELIIEKLKHHITRGQVDSHFAANHVVYARAKLAHIVVAREELAKELLNKLHDDGEEFAAMAAEHSLYPLTMNGALAGWIFRWQLDSQVAKAVFSAHSGEIIGPLAIQEGFQIIKIDELQPPILDGRTRAMIRQELFEQWLHSQLNKRTIHFPLLDAVQ
jgi:parvulin-like peptidyl-prolyl isomerase